MNEIDALIAGAVGGSIAGVGMAFIVLAEIKRLYDTKIMMLRMQIIGLQAMNGIDEDKL